MDDSYNGGGSGNGTRRPRAPFDSPLASRTRPSSEIFLQNPLKQFAPSGPGASEDQIIDIAAEKWLADLELYQRTLEEMAEVSLDKNFKDELNSIEKWFEVLSVGERTAALYALLQRTTPVQIRFFITVLQKIANRDPISSVLSPTNVDREPLQAQLNDAYVRHMGNNGQVKHGSFSSGSNYQHLQNPSAFMSPSPKHDPYATAFLPFSKAMPAPFSPWAQPQEISRPKSAADAPSAAPNPLVLQQQQMSTPRRVNKPQYKHNKSLSVIDDSLNVYVNNDTASWASVVNTPNATPQTKINAEIITSTAMKMAALNTVSSDAKKYRRRASVITGEDQKYIERELNSLRIQALNSPAPYQPSPSPSTWQMGIINGSPSPSGKTATSPQERKSGLSKVSYGSEPESPATAATPKKDNYIDPNLLQDVGSWLRSLRLHKYTENLADLQWQELVSLTDEDLEARGVNALGARRKMLKVFEQVKEAEANGALWV
jgi:hypothetical protein